MYNYYKCCTISIIVYLFIILKSALDDLHFASTVDEEIHWASEKALMIEKESPQVKLEAVRDQALVEN